MHTRHSHSQDESNQGSNSQIRTSRTALLQLLVVVSITVILFCGSTWVRLKPSAMWRSALGSRQGSNTMQVNHTTATSTPTSTSAPGRRTKQPQQNMNQIPQSSIQLYAGLMFVPRDGACKQARHQRVRHTMQLPGQCKPSCAWSNASHRVPGAMQAIVCLGQCKPSCAWGNASHRVRHMRRARTALPTRPNGGLGTLAAQAATPTPSVTMTSS
jgi:hypothetical protein